MYTYELICGHNTTLGGKKPSDTRLFCGTCQTYRTINDKTVESKSQQFKARIEPKNVTIHGIEIWFTADHIMDAFDKISDFAIKNGYDYNEVKQVIEVKPLN